MSNRQTNSLSAQAFWHFAALAAIALLLPEEKFGVPLWRLLPSARLTFDILLGGYLFSAALQALLASRQRDFGLRTSVLTTLSVFCLVFLYLLVGHVDAPKIVLAQVLAATLVCVPLAIWLRRFRWVGPAIMLLAAAGGLALALHTRSIAGQSVHPTKESTFVRTSFYSVSVDSYTDYLPRPAVRGGGIARFGDGYLLATGDGYLYRFGWYGSSDEFKVDKLAFRVPVNGDEFAKDTTGGLWQKKSDNDALGNNGEDASDTVIVWWFRTAGILVQSLDGRVRIFASHYYWKHAQGCWVERVSLLEGPRAALLEGSPTLRWRTIFETTPCLPIRGEGSRRGTPFAGHFGGGRMVLLDANTLLLSVGDFGFNGVASTRMLSQDMTSTYGKTVSIDVNSQSYKIYTSGHRNPQGLYIEPGGKVWETEQGPQGGDEFNQLRPGLNYGWPIVTYGVDYGTFAWPLNPKQGEHEGFEPPYFTWLPDIGVSDLIRVEADLFPLWKGDFLIGSMAAKTLFRTRVRNDRVVFTESISFGKRIRDITEGSDGRVVVWDDDANSIVSLRPATASSGAAAFATYCGGCHKVENGLSHRIGPDLWGVIGRKPASAAGYVDYSPAMRRVGETWTAERVEKFITNPRAMVPGTAMEFGGVPDAATRASIVKYVQSAARGDAQP